MNAELSPDRAAAPSPAQRLIQALPQLLERLRRADFDVGTEQYLAACDLILELSLRHAAMSRQQLCPSLAGLFCTRADEQQRFPELFDPWFDPLELEPKPHPPPSPVEPVVPEPSWLEHFRRQLLQLRWLALALALLVAIGVGYWLWPSEPEQVEQTSVTSTSEEPSKPPEPVKPRQRLIPPPQTPAEPVIPPDQYHPAWSEPARQAWLLPVTIWFFWFLSRLLLRQLTLARRKRKPGEEISLKHLQLALDHTKLLAGHALARTWRQLRRYRSHPMRRLDEAATVERTLAHGGYFQPVFRERQVPPAYLVLNDRRHAQDHAAAMVDELVATMRRENLAVSLFDYDSDPEHAVRTGDLGLARSPAELASVYADHDLLLAGDGETLVKHENGRAHHQLDAFAAFQRRLMLTLEPVWAQGSHQELYADADFQQFPLTSQGLAQLGRPASNASADHPADLPLPRELAIDPKRWLEERRLGKKPRNRLLAQLEGYLGPEGMLLLCATAAYPELNWRLTRALDRQLQLDEGDRELRLRRLSRLPWFRYGRIPDTLRKTLLRYLDAPRFRRVTGAFNALLEHLDDKPLKLPYAVPAWKGFAAYWKDLRDLSARHAALADQVFASVVRGRRPRLLEFSLARLEPGPIGRGWRGLFWPLILGLLLLPATVWLNLWAWQTWLEPDSRQAALLAMQARHQSITVSVAAPEALTRHGEALLSSLRAWGFKVQPLDQLDVSNQPKQLKQVERITKTEIFERIRKIVVEQLGVQNDDVTSGVSFVDDLGADELDLVELVMAFEEEFEIEIPDEKAEKMFTVQMVVDYIHNREYLVRHATRKEQNQIAYGSKAEPVRQILADRIAYLYYGEQPEASPVDPGSLPDEASVQIRLQAAPRVFRDPFVSPVKPIEPELVTI